MRRSALRLTALAVLLSLGFAPSALPAPARFAAPFDQVLPADTLAYVSFRVPEFKKKLESEPYTTLAADEEVKKLIDGIESTFAEEMKKMEKDVGFSLKDVWNAVDGEVAIYVGALDLKKDKPEPRGFGLLMDAGYRADEFSKLFAQTLKSMQDKEYESATEKHGDVTINVLTRRKAMKEAGDTMCAASLKSVYLMVSDLGLAKELLTALNGDIKDPLSSVENYKAIRDRVGKGEIFAYFDGAAVAKDLPQIMAEKMPEGQKETMVTLLKEMGVLALKGAGAGFSLAKEGPRMDAFVSLEHYKGFARIFAKNREVSFPDWLPKDVSSASVGHIDVEEGGKVVDSLIKIVGEAMAAQGGGGDPKEMIKQFLGIDIREDLLALIGGDMVSYTRYSEPMNENSLESLISISLKDGAKLQKSIDTLVERISNFLELDIETEEVQGTKILKFKPQGQPMELALGISAQNLLYGNLKGVREFIKGGMQVPGEGGWATREEIKPLVARLPQKAVSAMAMSSQDLQYWAYMTREGKLPEMFKLPQGVPGPDEQKAKQALELIAKNMVSSDTIKKHLQGGVFYLVAEDAGLSLVGQLLLKNVTK
jgi:hypothetical protein